MKQDGYAGWGLCRRWLNCEYRNEEISERRPNQLNCGHTKCIFMRDIHAYIAEGLVETGSTLCIITMYKTQEQNKNVH